MATAPDIANRIEAAPVFPPAAAEPPAKLPLIDLAGLADKDPPPRDFILLPFIPAGTVTLFTGAGGVGKSLFGQQLATAVASAHGKFAAQFLGLPVQGGVTLYVTAEDDADELHRRQIAIGECMGLPINVPGLHLSTLCGEEDNAFCTFDRNGALVERPSFARVKQAILEVGATFVVLDNLAHLFAGNENDRGHVTQFANMLNRLAKETGATVLLVGHPAKGADSDYSGSTAWLNAVRSHVFMHNPTAGDRGGVPFDANARVLDGRKSNYARNGDRLEFRWHKGAFVRLDELPEDKRKEVEADAMASSDDAMFLRCLDLATKQGRTVSHNKNATNFAPRVFTGMVEGRGVSEKRFKAAMERLLSRAEILVDQPVRKSANRKDLHGIVRVRIGPDCAPVAP